MKKALFFIFCTVLCWIVFADDSDSSVEVGSLFEQQYEHKTALVIGNGNYQHFATLKNPVSEAQSMAAVLEQLGFNVITIFDGTREEILLSLQLFEETLKGDGGLALFHYGGHGIQVNGENYIIPVDADIPDELRVQTRAVPFGEVIATLNNSGSETNIMILDACRDNPLPAATRSSSTRGLSVVQTQPPDSIIVYSAEAGTTAQDGVFTPTLMKLMVQPGIEFTDMLREVRRQVREMTDGEQRPGEYSQLEREVFLGGRIVEADSGSQNGTVNQSSVPFDIPLPEYTPEDETSDKYRPYRDTGWGLWASGLTTWLGGGVTFAMYFVERNNRYWALQEYYNTFDPSFDYDAAWEEAERYNDNVQTYVWTTAATWTISGILTILGNYYLFYESEPSEDDSGIQPMNFTASANGAGIDFGLSW